MSPYLLSGVAILGFAHLGFVIAAVIRRNDVADIIWGPGFIVAAVAAILAKPDAKLEISEIVVLAFVAIWGIRLSVHISRRFLSSSTEDQRYLNWRKSWGRSWLLRSYLQVFLLQAAALYVIALPIVYCVASAPREVSWLTMAGGFVWVFGFLFEAVSDEQLRRFKLNSQNKGQLMDRGLWSWSRHPNYFGEVVQWWGLYFMCVNLSSWWLVVSPVTITFLILKVSGIPLLEEQMAHRPQFAAYRAKTSKFIPMPKFNIRRRSS